MLDRLSGRLDQYLDLLSARQKLTASNIANAETPGYKTKDIDFQHEFQDMLRGGAPDAIEVPGLVTRSDGNNVSIDREARQLSETAARFSLASTLLKSHIQTIRSAIQEGRNG